MKKLIFIITLFLFVQNFVIAANNNLEVYSQDGLFGLKNKTTGECVTEAEYKKLIRIGDSSWLVAKKTRYGLIDNNGNILVPIKYRHAERILGKFAKLGNDNDYGLYGENGEIILPPMYSSIEPLYGNMFLTCRKYKYGISDFNGNIILPNDFDDIYMPNKTSLRIQYYGKWFEIERASADNIELPKNSKKVTIDNQEFTFTKLVTDTGVMSGYYTLTTADYVLKIISSISPAYEQTIDDLMLSHGADTVNIVMKMSWLPMFPFVYAKKYFNNLMAPNNGPLSPIRQNMRRKLIE